MNEVRMISARKRMEIEALAMGNVSHVKNSGDRKTGRISVTYASQCYCPTRCPMHKHGCYGEAGHCGCYGWKVNHGIVGTPASMLPEQVYKKGCKETVRLNVVGDMAIPGTSVLNREMVKMYRKAYPSEYVPTLYTYTHCEFTGDTVRTIKEALEEGFVINLSCEDMGDAMSASDLGVPAVLVVKHMDVPRKVIADRTFVKCPNQASDGRVQCKDCKLCMKARKEIVVFEWHNSKPAPECVMETL